MKLLFAAANDIEFIVGVILMVVYVVANLWKNVSESVTRKPPQPGVPQDQPKVNTPQQDLERFLRELGVRRPGQPPAATPPKPPPPPQPKRLVPAPESKKPAKPRKEPVAKLDRRHIETKITEPTVVHSGLEKSHLESKVGHDTMAVADEVVASSTQQASVTTAGPARDMMLIAMLGDPKQVSRAFVLGQVLGTPVGLRDP